MTYPTIEEVLTRFDERTAAKRERMEGLGDDLAAAVRAVKSCDPEDGAVSIFVPDYAFRVDVDVHELDSWDGLQPYADALAAEGFEADSVHDMPDSLMRMVYHSRDGKYEAVLLAGILSGEGAACKAIETGETKPVLKFVCPGDADYPEQAEEVTA